MLSIVTGSACLLSSCTVTEDDPNVRPDDINNEIRMNFVVSRAGLQQIDGVRMTPNILLMTQQQAVAFNEPSSCRNIG